MSTLALSPCRRPVRAAAGEPACTTIEWRDFLVCSAASALVVPQLFLPGSGPAIRFLISLATFGAGFLARALFLAVREVTASGKRVVTVSAHAAI
jgi:hypothetical protein